MPPPAPRCDDPAFVEFAGDPGEGCYAAGLDVFNDLGVFSGALCGLGLHCSDRILVAASGAKQRGRTVRVAELDAAGFGGGEGRLGSIGDALALVLIDHRQQPDGEPIDVGVVGTGEVDAAISDTQGELGVTAKAIQLGDDELGT